MIFVHGPSTWFINLFIFLIWLNKYKVKQWFNAFIHLIHFLKVANLPKQLEIVSKVDKMKKEQLFIDQIPDWEFRDGVILQQRNECLQSERYLVSTSWLSFKESF